MTPEEIIKKCEENNVKLKVRNNKLLPEGNLTVDFIKLSHEFVPFKQQVIDYIKANQPENVVEGPDQPFLVAQKASVSVPENFLPNSGKIGRLRIPCIHLGEPMEKAAGCGCNGAVIHKCNVFEKCRRVGKHEGIAVCTECDKYEPVS